MSTLLQSYKRPEMTDGDAAPAYFHNGIPYTSAGAIAVKNLGVIDHYHQGLPFTDVGRLVVAFNGVTDRFNGGAAPFDTSNFLVITSGATTNFSGGVPYDATGRVAITLV